MWRWLLECGSCALGLSSICNSKKHILGKHVGGKFESLNPNTRSPAMILSQGLRRKPTSGSILSIVSIHFLISYNILLDYTKQGIIIILSPFKSPNISTRIEKGKLGHSCVQWFGTAEGVTAGKLQNAGSCVCLSGCCTHDDECVVNGSIAMVACWIYVTLNHVRQLTKNVRWSFGNGTQKCGVLLLCYIPLSYPETVHTTYVDQECFCGWYNLVQWAV